VHKDPSSDDRTEARSNAQPVEASVQVGSTITGYHRLGSGPPLLVVRKGNDPVWRVILPVLATHFRLLVPRVPDGEPDFDGWLRGFLDGLGVDGTRVVADRTQVREAIQFAAAEPERIEKLVLLTADAVAGLPPVETLVVDPARDPSLSETLIRFLG
jgi:hypothetical protein